MELVRGVEGLPVEPEATVVTVGFFDGVHLGHREVLAAAVARARDRRVPSVAVTFDRHPREVLTPGREPRLLTTDARKAALIEATGIDILVVLAFTRGFSEIAAEDFVREILVDGIHAVHAVVGVNFTFGHRASGTIETLREVGGRFGLSAEGVPLVEVDGRPVSSSSVRAALAAGDLDWPRTSLDRRYSVDGEVSPGHGRGSGLGFPTANLRTWPRLLLPGQGIYAGVAERPEGRYPAAIDVGTNPTFGVDPLHIEAFLLDYEGGDFRGEPMTVEFWERLRDEVRYDDVDALVRAIAEDVERTRSIVPARDRAAERRAASDSLSDQR